MISKTWRPRTSRSRTGSRLRQSVSELMIFDSTDAVCADGAKNFAERYKYGAWTVETEGVERIGWLTHILKNYMHLKRVTFQTHGSPGRIAFGLRNKNPERLTMSNLGQISVPPSLFEGEGQLLFLGCEVGRGYAGEDFLVAAGKRFFAGRGGFVGGATTATLGWPWGSTLPYIIEIGSMWGPIMEKVHPGKSGNKPEIGLLRIFQLDSKGNVIGRKAVR